MNLLEVLIVLTIIAITTTMGSFGYRHYTNNTYLRTAARQLTSDMAYAKQSSITQGLCYRMTITTGTPGQYTIEQGNAACCSSCTTNTTFTVLSTKTTTAIGAGLSIYSTTYGSNIIYFQTRGTTSLGSVVFNNIRNSTATITSNITGKTYVTYSMQ